MQCTNLTRKFTTMESQEFLGFQYLVWLITHGSFPLNVAPLKQVSEGSLRELIRSFP